MKPTIADQFKFAAGLTWCLTTSFIYYVTFVQFGLMHYFENELHLARPMLITALAMMALCAIVAGIAAGRILDIRRRKLQNILGAVGACSILAFGLAFLFFQVTNPYIIILLTSVLGAVLGTLIVLLLFCFNRFIHLRIRPFYAGIATGLAYLAANIMAGVISDPQTFGTVDGILMASNSVAILFFWEYSESARFQPASGQSGSLGKVLLALSPLALLVFLDTFCFYPLGADLIIKNAVFLTPSDWISNGTWHLLIALVGALFGFGIGGRRMVIAGFVGLTIAAALLIANQYYPTKSFIFPAYGLAVGTYTITLFTLWGRLLPEKNFATYLAVGMALCGWIASGSGIGASMTLWDKLPQTAFFAPIIPLAVIGIMILMLHKKIFNDFADEARLEEKTRGPETESPRSNTVRPENPPRRIGD